MQQARTGERTVQGVLEAALTTVPGAVPREMAVGRTDARVHALAMMIYGFKLYALTTDFCPVNRAY